MERAPQSVTLRVVLKAFLSADHVSPATGKTIAVVISKNGAAFANPSAGATNATEIASGWYYVDLSTTDTGTAGPLIVRGTCSGVDDVEPPGFNVVNAHNAGFDGVPSVTAGASTGLPLAVDSSGRVDVLKINGTSQTARDIGASVLLSAGTGAGQLDFTSGVVKANLAQILGTALTETSGLLAAAFKKFFNIATPASTMDSLTLVATATNLTNAPTAGDFTSAMKTSLNAATPAVTVSDKTGFSLSAGGVQAIWDALTSALTTAGSIGKKLTDWVIGTTQTGDSYARLGAPAGASVSADVAAVKANTASVVASIGSGLTLTVSERNSTAAALLDLAAGIETGVTLRQGLRLQLAAMAGKLSGAAGTTVTIRDTNDSKNRIVATVDADGNRTAITLDPS